VTETPLDIQRLERYNNKSEWVLSQLGVAKKSAFQSCPGLMGVP
jgi:hypothetical protein